MRSYDESKYFSTYPACLSWPSYQRRRQFSRLSSSRLNGEPTLREKLAELIQEHRDLDDAISALFGAGSGNDAVITRLKKRKLQIKDEIARFEAVS
jgi:hypothetical protein